MGLIRSKDTRPEMAVRSLVHRMGYRFRLHGRSLPGRPDLVFAGRRAVIFVHGCFWHQHACQIARGRRRPAANRRYWIEKFRRNRERDQRAARRLRRMGWRVLVIWECQTRPRRIEQLAKRIDAFLSANHG